MSEIRKELIKIIIFVFIFGDADENDIPKEKEPEIILKDILDGKNLYLGKEVVNRVMLGKKVYSNNGLDFYEYPQRILTNEEKDSSNNILAIGEMGVGKTTWINSLINYLQDIQLEEKGRYILCDESGKKWDGIMEKPIVYNIEPTKRFMNPIRIIDTQGFGYINGINNDKKIIENIKNLLQGPEINSINAICMFFAASVTRLINYKNIINQYISLFDKEIRNNIIIIFTFTSGLEYISALEILKDKHNYLSQILGGIEKYPYFKFDNKNYFRGDMNHDNLIHESNKKNFRHLLKYIISLKRVSL